MALAIALGLTGAAPELAWGSTPQAWSRYDQEVQRACLAASRLRQSSPAGDRIDLPAPTTGPGAATGLVSVLLLRGTYPQPHMAGRSGLELCVYDASRRQVRLGDADRLNLQPAVLRR
ncbi:hypothetical protein SYNGFB01_10345 [Synechococcus sp. GFB01]|nr:hypothetical protein SYNGFB01_10345 [Synechococcus sp. GFB01]